MDMKETQKNFNASTLAVTQDNVAGLIKKAVGCEPIESAALTARTHPLK